MSLNHEKVCRIFCGIASLEKLTIANLEKIFLTPLCHLYSLSQVPMTWEFSARATTVYLQNLNHIKKILRGLGGLESRLIKKKKTDVKNLETLSL